MPKTANEVVKLAKDAGVKIVDLRFVDLPGMWQHFSIPVEDLNEDLFAEGIGFDGSSIRGFQQISESDMLLFPDPDTAYVDPVLEVPTLSIICDVKDPITGKPYSRDPRYVTQKAEAYLKSSGIADVSYWGPELEFYIFEDVRYDQMAYTATIESTRMKAYGIQVGRKAPISVTSSGTKRATSLCRHPINCRIYAPKSF
jgi:glutamine synthetase